MHLFKIEKYSQSYVSKWNNFVDYNPNSSFLFHRNFMEYHSDRFLDFSFLIFQNEALIGICAANKEDNKVYSHQGLTYGGLLLNPTLDKSIIEIIFKHIISYLDVNNIKDMFIKEMPIFYGNDRTRFINHLTNESVGEIYRKDKVLAIDYSLPFTIHKTKLKHYRKNESKGFRIEKTNDFTLFWNAVLIPRLKEKHNAQPVHSLSEIELLNGKFQKNIKQYNIYLDDEILAGITIFDKGDVVKSQYGATTNRGEKERALEYLFLHLIYNYKTQGKAFFSMGTVTEDNALGYNPGLLKQKQELGCMVYEQEFFHLKIS